MSDQNLNSVPGSPEVWLIDGITYLIYYVPDTLPPVPMAWQVRDAQALDALTSTTSLTIDRRLTMEDAIGSGMMTFGFSDELLNTSDHPWDAFEATFDAEAEIRPWLRDPEILTLTAQAFLEGRELTDGELKTTEWWQTSTESQRQWLLMSFSDPATADQLLADTRLIVSDALVTAGIGNAGAGLVNFIADRVTMGIWSQEYANTQMRKLSDPFAPGELDADLVNFVSDEPLDTTRRREDEVQALVGRWLGPRMAAGWTQENYAEWAGKLRNDPDAQQELEGLLKQQRLSLFPQYENENLSYEDIAGPWRSVFQQVWGQIPDETDDLFSQVISTGDINKAQKLLREKGIETGNSQVVNDAVKSMFTSTGGSGVREVLA